MKKIILLIVYICLGSTIFLNAKPYPKESMSELKRQLQIAWNNNEDITPYMENIRLKTLQLSPKVSLLNQEDVYYDMKLLILGKDYQVGLSNCEQDLFKSGCDYNAIGKYALHRCFEVKSKGKLIRVGYCTIGNDGLEPKYRASAQDIALWNYIDNTVKTAYKKYLKEKNIQEQKETKRKQQNALKLEAFAKRASAYNQNPYVIIFNLTPIKYYKGTKSKGYCKKIAQIRIKKLISIPTSISDFACVYGDTSTSATLDMEIFPDTGFCKDPKDIQFYDEERKGCDITQVITTKNGNLSCNTTNPFKIEILGFEQIRNTNFYSYTYQENDETKKTEYLNLLQEKEQLCPHLPVF